ncbi:MAG: MBL fold metallo-hydrolase, partial [Chloroflexi bacterium]|nr:MBL fold metallo-hydrolase [Chloroflexota bacterium]
LGLAARLKAEADVEVTMHRLDWEMAQYIMKSSDEFSLEEVLDWMRSLGVPESGIAGYAQLLSFGRLLFPADFQPDILLEGDDTPLGEGKLHAILTPGHTPGHVCVYDKERRLLFSGDHVLGKITPHVGPSLLTDDDQLGRYLASLEKVRQLDVDLVLPAHEEPFGNLSRRVDELLQHHEERLEHVLAVLQDHPSTAWGIATQIDWAGGSCQQMDVTNRLLALQETLAHLQLLHHRGQVAVTESDGVTLYVHGGSG